MPLIELENLPNINIVRMGPRGGVPLVFMHPVGLNLTWWSEQFRGFIGEREVVAFDMPSHGLSGKLEGPPTFDLEADVLRGVLDHVGAKSADLVGISVGGMIAQAFALRYPERVRSLSLVTTLCTFSEQGRQALRERARVARAEGMGKIAQLANERWFTADFRERRPDILDRVTIDLAAADPEFHARMWDMISELEFEEQLSAIRCPALVISATQDINAPPVAGRKIAARIQGSTFVELPGLGHLPPFEEPDLFNQVLRDFLARISGSSAASAS